LKLRPSTAPIASARPHCERLSAHRPGTVEEKIWELQQRKAQTIADVLGEEGFARNLSQTDLEYLFSKTNESVVIFD